MYLGCLDHRVQEWCETGRGVQQHIRGHLLPGYLALQERIGESVRCRYCIISDSACEV